MFDSYLIETDDEIAGIVVRSGQGFSFHAVGADFNPDIPDRTQNW